MKNVTERINKLEERLVSDTKLSEKEKLELATLIDEAKNSIDKVNTHNEYLTHNFEKMSFSVPEDDLRYYKGVLVNNLKVYLGEFDEERRKRDIAKLKEYAYIPIYSFGLIITIMGVMTCIFAILYGILIK